MVLVDTSVWIDHLRAGEPLLVKLLQSVQVLGHSCVQGELACGSLAQRNVVLDLLGNLPQAPNAEHHEVMRLIEQRQLMGLGIGYVDVCLLASTLLAGNAQIWSRDKRLMNAAAKLGIAFEVNL